MTPHSTQYALPLSEKDRLFVKFLTSKKEVVAFVLQYHTKTPKSWRTVIRYDTSHEHVHKDVFAYSKKGKARVDYVMGIEGGLGTIFTQTLLDLRQSWKQIKENFMFQ